MNRYQIYEMRASHTKCAEDSIPEGNDYGLKSALLGQNDFLKITGSTPQSQILVLSGF
jgi:hypothetical protein